MAGIAPAVSLAGFLDRLHRLFVERVSRQPAAGVGRWSTIFNGVDLARYALTPSVPPDAPLMFLGRLEPIKGAHHAIAIARRPGAA